MAKLDLENATIGDLQQALSAGAVTAAALVHAYLARIAAYDRAGPSINAVRELNPDADAIAAALRCRGAGGARPLAGVPILVKDNIATADRQHTTAGSLALAEARAGRDATVVQVVREAARSFSARPI